MKSSVSLRVGVRVDLLQGHDVVDGLLHFIRVDAERGLQQLEGQTEEETVGADVNRLRLESCSTLEILIIDVESCTSFLEYLRDDSGRKWFQSVRQMHSINLITAASKISFEYCSWQI